MASKCASSGALIAILLAVTVTARAGGRVTLEEFTARVVDSRLEIKYRIRNATNREIFLTNSLYRVGSFDHPPRRDLAFTELRDGILEIRKAIPLIPKDVTIEYRAVPYLTRLAPASTLAEEFSLPVPVEGFQAYNQPGLGSVSARAVRLTVGWCSTIVPREEKTSIGPVLVADPEEAFLDEQTVVSDLVELGVPTKMSGVE